MDEPRETLAIISTREAVIDLALIAASLHVDSVRTRTSLLLLQKMIVELPGNGHQDAAFTDLADLTSEMRSSGDERWADLQNLLRRLAASK